MELTQSCRERCRMFIGIQEALAFSLLHDCVWRPSDAAEGTADYKLIPYPVCGRGTDFASIWCPQLKLVRLPLA